MQCAECGSYALTITERIDGEYAIWCSNCGAFTQTIDDRDDDDDYYPEEGQADYENDDP